MKGILLGLLYCATAVALTSCEGGTTFTKTIDNQSSESVSLVLYTNFGDTKTTTVGPNSKTEVFWSDQMGNFVDNSFNCTTLIDSVTISISKGKQLTKDIMNSDNWRRESKDGRNSREDCTFTFTDSDLQ